ncbi:MAG TPA: alkaline phosphatase family protein [Pyrinomonadaceae bacterium]|nr:alkaline phosphatase family protein [Pyrinomonadaceae bacterium]
MPSGNQLSKIQHVVTLMLENRSFDHMLGFLYADAGNKSPTGQPFEGLTGKETNPDANGKPVKIFKIKATDKNAYFMPGADPGEGYAATNSELFGSVTAPVPPVATNQGFVKDFAYTLGWESKKKGWSILPGTVAQNIMGVFTPEMLPVLSGLARGYAVCDQWYSSAPTETLPNRAFANAATSQGHMNDSTKSFTVQSIFGLMSKHNVNWAIYGYNAKPLTRLNFPDTTAAPESHFGLFKDFQAAAAAGTLPPYTFLEPSWGSTGNSQHPNYDMALGEQLIHDVYYALRNGKGWNETLLIITYDEHGGCYDHVAPPQGATPPDNTPGEYGFDFTRFGVRVPAVLVSPLIKAGTVFRVAANSTPIDHTSILKTVEKRWNLPALTKRDAAAPSLGGVLTLSTPRTDDPLQGVAVPKPSGKDPGKGKPSHMQQVHAELAAQLPVKDEEGNVQPAETPSLKTSDDYRKFISARTSAWSAYKLSLGSPESQAACEPDGKKARAKSKSKSKGKSKAKSKKR